MVLRRLFVVLIGGLIDCIIGDPINFPHSIRLIGGLVGFFEKLLYAKEGNKSVARGGLLVVLTLVSVAAVVLGIINICSYFSFEAGLCAQILMVWQVLAAKSLKDAAYSVKRPLDKGDMKAARKSLSMIVGRDTGELDKAGIIRACVESVSENTSDGVIAPLFYCIIGGPVLAYLYKAINTMDSMIGYKNGRYLYFGRCAAKLDDLVNIIPSRLSALLIIAVAFLSKKDGKRALRIFLRDRFNHESPNSAQAMSACAGALGIWLGGPASYFGIIKNKPFMGDAVREPEPEDIGRAVALMYGSFFLMYLPVAAALLVLFIGMIR